jgi:hypothetical protein
MALILRDRVKETTAVVGTGNATLLGASLGFQSFSAVMSVGDTCYYTIADPTGSDWEVGLGTYSATDTLTRTTVFESSNAGALVVFVSGSKDVFITYPADRSVAQGRALINNMVYGL